MYMDAKPSRRDINTDTEMLWVRNSRVLNTAWGRIKKKKKNKVLESKVLEFSMPVSLMVKMCNKRKDSKMKLGRQPRAKNYNGSFLLHLAEIDLQGNGLTLIGYLATQKQCFVSASGKYKMCLIIIIFFFWLLIRCKK